MLGFLDNVTLAVTKLRSRRIRLIVTLIVSGLLFTVLVAGSLVARGTLASLKDFTKEGFSSRFFLTAYEMPQLDKSSDQAAVKRAKVIEKEMLAKKVAEANRLGIPFDPAAEPKATIEGGPEGAKQTILDTSHPASAQALRELAPPLKLSDHIKSAAKGYELKSVYTGGQLVSNGHSTVELSPIVAGKEVKGSRDFSPTADSLVSFANMAQTLDNSLIEPFLLEGASLTATPGSPVPILAPVDAVEKLVGLKPLTAKATSKNKLARLKDIRSKARNLEFDICYRNTEAVALGTLAKQQSDEAAAGKGKTDYVAPAVQYAAPATPCAPTSITKDTRSADEKALAAKLEQFKITFGAEAPQTTVIKFKVVGVLPQIQYGSSAFDLTNLVSSLVTSTLGPGWFISNQAATAHPILRKLATDRNQPFQFAETLYLEFSDRANQKRFLQEHTCQPPNGPSIPIGPGSEPENTDPTADCAKNGKFFLVPFGNPLAAIYDSQAGVMKFLGWLLAVIAGISAIIMMGTVGKIIADSRKETSVFRAVGAKRLDIAQIYLLYAGILASQAFLISLGIGIILALVLEYKIGPTLSVQAVLAFNATNADKAFHVIGLNVFDLLGIFVFTLATGIASAILPLLTNLRRNPIKDMREE